MSPEHISSRDVAVTICAFNAAATLDGALGSVAAQEEPPGEVVIVDDGSTDDTSAVAASWADMLPVRVVRLDENAGIGCVRRIAVENTHLPYVAILDADDFWFPDHLTTMTSLYRRNGGIITAKAMHWVPGIGIGEADEHARVVPPPERQMESILHHCFLCIATLFSREDYDHSGGFRDLRKSEDWDLWIRMIRAGTRVTRGDHPTVLYRISAHSASFGYTSASSDVTVVEQAITEAASPRELVLAHRCLRRVRARADLGDAFDYARAGNRNAARVAAFRALRGEPRTMLRAGALLLAPHQAAKYQLQRSADLSVYVDD